MRTSANELPWSAQRGDWRIEIVAGDSPERRHRERQLLAAGVPVSFGSRFEVDSLAETSPSVFVSILDSDGHCVGGFVIRSRSAPLLPGHCVLRAERFGSSFPLAAAESAVSVMLDWILRNSGILRASVDVFSFDETRRHELGRVLERCGFQRAEQASGYNATLVIDLTGSEDEIFGSLHHSARRKVRQIERLPVAVRPIDDPAFGERMNQLLQETLVRTGGLYHRRDWAGRIDLSSRNPDLSRIVGLFRTDTTGSASLLAFAWGCHNGDHVYYSEAASTRDTGDLRVPLAYALMWDLIVWGRRTGARWFDLGGITHGTHSDSDPLGGISDFKRYFSQEVVKVRDEWILDDHSWKASLVAAVHSRVRRR